MKSKKKVLILGAGISGLGAAHACKLNGDTPIVLEKDTTYGGLCGSFEINGFTFDRFVHLSFAESDVVNAIFSSSVQDVITHIPNPYNLYKRKWIKHPAQNNLFPLAANEKKQIIDDFLKRENLADISEVENYEQWLKFQFGNYFAENFPMVYTTKYWMTEARDLGTEWVGKRIYQPSVEEVIFGANNEETPITYYAKEMRYPLEGGYKSFLKSMAENTDIRFNETVVKINPITKIVYTERGNSYSYDELYSSIPLPEIINMIEDVPGEILHASSKLRATSGYHISIGLKTLNIPPYLWWYIYDKDILAARVYSPSLCSPNNAPPGCSSLQFEVYCNKDQYTQTELYNGTVMKLIESNIIQEEDILFAEMRFEKYANVIFDKFINESRRVTREYLLENSIKPFGRFGEWDYLWSDQSLLSGINIVNNV